MPVPSSRDLAAMLLAVATSLPAQIFNDPASHGNAQALTVTGVPRPGMALTFRVNQARPTDIGAVFLAAAPAIVPFSPFGTAMIDPGSILIGLSFQGETTQFTLPQLPVGTPIFVQGLRVPLPTGTPSLTNLSRFYFLGNSGSPTNNIVLDPLPGVVATRPLTVAGQASRAGSSITIDGGTAPVTVIANQGPNNNRFSANITLQPDRRNHLFATETPTAGARLEPVVASVVHDSQAPDLFIDFPSDNQDVHTPRVILAGRIGDVLSGFTGLTVEARVNGVPTTGVVNRGIGTNGTWECANVPLNAIDVPTVVQVVARDSVGNQSTRQITLTQRAFQGPHMRVISGDRQTGVAHTWLPQPIKVQLLRADGLTPYCRKIVTFRIARSDGRLAPAAQGDGSCVYQVESDVNGYAQAYWRLGADAGCGNNRVEVTSRDMDGFVAFCCSAQPMPPRQINVGQGDGQVAATGAALPLPLRVWVSDGCNGVANVPVLFQVTRGTGFLDGGSLGAVTAFTAFTGATGHADVRMTLGTEAGNHLVTASVQGLENSVTFQAVGLARQAGTPTSFRGIVLDNANQPIGGATCWVEFPGYPNSVQVLSTAAGAFDIPLTRSGPAHLHVDGSTANQLAGNPIPIRSFPFLIYEVLVVPEAVNSMPTPVLLPQLDPVNERVYDGVNDVTLEVDGIDGLRMLVKAGSMRLRDGTPAPAGTVLSLNQVHVDKIPMAIPDGASPPFSWTLQPAMATFDPPIEIHYPNMSGLPAGAIAYFLSFDHATGAFEIVSSAQVSLDGSEIVSDPGDGLSVAGWGCNCPPYSVSTDCRGCTTTCIDSGSITGGIVTPSHPGQGNPTNPPIGTLISFLATDCADSGGTRVVRCPDGSVRGESIPAAGIVYRHTLQRPDGSQVHGSGPVWIGYADQCGTYTCTFYVTANRVCPPAERRLPASRITTENATWLPSVSFEIERLFPNTSPTPLGEWRMQAVPDLAFEAVCVPSTQEWRFRVSEAHVSYRLGVNLGSTIDVDEALINATSDCSVLDAMYADIDYGSSLTAIPTHLTYFSSLIVWAHEFTHVIVYGESVPPAFDTLVSVVESVRVPLAQAGSAQAATTALSQDPDFQTALGAFIAVHVTANGNHADPRFVQRQRAVAAPLLQAITSRKAFLSCR